MRIAPPTTHQATFNTTHEQPISLIWTWFSSSNTNQATLVPQMSNTMHLNDLNSTGWYIDFGATSHLHSNEAILNFISEKNISPSYVLVCDGSKIPIQNFGHSILPNSNPYRILTLKNILITPNIIKNLIYVRHFTRDNNYSIEFDAFGFSMKDYRTKKTLLRCDSTGDLYLVTSTPQALATISPSLWHQ